MEEPQSRQGAQFGRGPGLCNIFVLTVIRRFTLDRPAAKVNTRNTRVTP